MLVLSHILGQCSNGTWLWRDFTLCFESRSHGRSSSFIEQKHFSRLPLQKNFKVEMRESLKQVFHCYCLTQFCKSLERSKRKKQNSKAANGVGGREATANELENETQVFVWELEDLCACASYSNWSTHGNKDLFSSQICQILQSVFQIDNWEEYDYSNVRFPG